MFTAMGLVVAGQPSRPLSAKSGDSGTCGSAAFKGPSHGDFPPVINLCRIGHSVGIECGPGVFSVESVPRQSRDAIREGPRSARRSRHMLWAHAWGDSGAHSGNALWADTLGADTLGKQSGQSLGACTPGMHFGHASAEGTPGTLRAHALRAFTPSMYSGTHPAHQNSPSWAGNWQGPRQRASPR